MSKIKFILLLFVISITQAQQTEHKKAELVFRCENSCSSYNSIMENTIKLTDKGEITSQFVVIRIFSKEKLEFALSDTTMDPLLVSQWINKVYNFPLSRIIIMRSDEDLQNRQDKAITELWTVSEDKKFPSFVESLTAEQICLKALDKKNQTAEGIKSYNSKTKKLISDLEKNSKQVGWIIGYYFKKPNPMMKRRLLNLKNLISKNKSVSGQYVIKLVKWTGEYSINEVEPKYPRVFIITNKNCQN